MLKDKIETYLFPARRLAHQAVCVFRENYGYSFMHSWEIALFPYLSFVLNNGSPASTYMAFTSFLGAAIAGLLLILFTRKSTTFFVNRRLVVTFGLLGALGLLVVVSSTIMTIPLPLCYAGPFLSGFSFSVLTAAWLQRFIAQGLDSVAWNYLVGTVMGTAIFFALIIALPKTSLVLLALCPLASGLTMKTKLRPDSEKSDDDITHFLNVDRSARQPSSLKNTLPLYVATFIVCLSLELIRRQFYGKIDFSTSSVWVTIILLTAAACFIAKAIASSAYISRSLLVFDIVIPVICAGTLMLLDAVTPAILLIAYSFSMVGIELVIFMVVFKVAELYNGNSSYALPSIGAILLIENALSSFRYIPDFPEASDTSIVVLLCMVSLVLVIANHRSSFSISVPDKETVQIRKIRAVALRYHLTTRETDILELWGQGHTSNYVEKQLYISKNTVKSHLTHIYEKTGTENKEELLQLIEKQEL